VRVLRYGDVIAMGRTVLLYGAPHEIAARLASLRGVDLSAGVPPDSEELDSHAAAFSLEAELDWGQDVDARATLHTLLPPELPNSLSPGQAAQVSELLQYLHLRIRGLIQSVKAAPRSEQVVLEARQWQNLVDLQARLAGYLRSIGEPET